MVITMIQNLQDIKNCSFVKTVLMLLVILGHSLAFWSGDWFTANPAIESNAISIINSWIGSFHIYAFTLVSGYIFAFKIFGGVRQLSPIFKKQGKATPCSICFCDAYMGAADLSILF